MGGDIYPRYLVWHPEDHIHWELAHPAPFGGPGVGASFKIVEAFARNPAYLVDSIETVTKLDTTGIRLERTIGGTKVFSLEHCFTAESEGCRYNSQMIVGSHSFPVGQGFTRIIRPFVFSEKMGRALSQYTRGRQF